MKRHTRLTLAAAAGSAVAFGGLAIPAHAEIDGTSDAVVICDAAHEVEPDLYSKPGFLCEIEPDAVIVNDVEYPVIRYRLEVRKGKKEITRSDTYEYGEGPDALFISAKKLDAGDTYRVDYVAEIESGEWVSVSDKDFVIDVPKAPGKPKAKKKWGKLAQGTGKGYTLKWPNAKRTEGYRAQVKTGGKWLSIDLATRRSAEVGRTKKKPAPQMRVRSWNAGGYSPWVVK